MTRRLLWLLSVLLALAGGAFFVARAEPAAGERSASSDLATDQRLSIELADGVVKTIVVRAQLESDSKPALLIGLHGYGMDASQITTLVDIKPSFDHVYLAPDGFHQLEDGSRAWFPIGADADGGVVVHGQAVEAFAERFERYVRLAVELVDAERIYIIGYSQGGAAALTLAATRPDLADGFVALAGSVLPTVKPERESEARLFVGHGTLDAFVETEKMRVDIERLRRLGLDVTYGEYDIPHVVSAAQRRDVTAWLEQLSR